MGNQHQSTLEERIEFLARNAVIGDGYLWKRPQSTNYKIIYTSTTPDLLQAKMNLCPEIFTTGVKEVDTTNHKGRFDNAKPLYRLASISHPSISKVKSDGKDEILKTLTIEDIALWYLDDGCLIKRNDCSSYRVTLSIGDSANTDERKLVIENRLKYLFGDKFGRITKNNSRATENNKSWIVPLEVARKFMQLSDDYGVLKRKILR